MSTTPDSENPTEPVVPEMHPAAFQHRADQAAPTEPESQTAPPESPVVYEPHPDHLQQALHRPESSVPQQPMPDQSLPTQESPSQGYASQTYAAQQYPVPEYEPQTAWYAEPAAPTQQPSAPAQSAPQKGRGGTLVAGIAIGALLGGIIGGGTAAVVATNLPSQSGSTSLTSPAGTITLNNMDDVSVVGAVASVGTPSVVTISVVGSLASGSGSGVIYTEDGYIVTNAHVATLDGEAGANPTIRVRLSDGRVFDGTVVGVDPFADLAIIKIEADGLTAVKIADSDNLNVGDLAVAIGAPLSLANTVTSGVISALYRGISVGTANLPDDGESSDEDRGDDGGAPWDFRFGDPGDGSQSRSAATGASVTLPVIQTDASINPGNSGGALLNANAELIGINVAIASNRSDSDSAGSDGLGFAIPSNLVVRVADAIIAGEQPSHGLLGAGVDDSSRDTDEDANHTGGLIVELTPGGAAEQAGLLVGDVVTAVNGIPVDSGTSLSALIRMQEGGSTVTLSYTRGGVPGEVQATLGTLDW